MSVQTSPDGRLTAVASLGECLAIKNPPLPAAGRLRSARRDPRVRDPSFPFKVDTPRPALESRCRA